VLIALVASGIISSWRTPGRARLSAHDCRRVHRRGPFVPRSAWAILVDEEHDEHRDPVEVDPEGSAEARYNIWRVAGTIIKENPVAGIGLGVYPLAHAMYAPRVGVPVSALGFRDTHSTYLNVAAETGIPGAILFLTMVAVVAVPADHIRRRARGTPRAHQLLALELGLLGFMLAGIFGSFAKLSSLHPARRDLGRDGHHEARACRSFHGAHPRCGPSVGGRTRRAG
jgi:hypothetical protein